MESHRPEADQPWAGSGLVHTLGKRASARTRGFESHRLRQENFLSDDPSAYFVLCQNKSMGMKEVDSKLQTVLENGLFDEPNVVYILSRVRKLLDFGTVENKDFTTLRFYCNWVLHNRLNHKQTTNFLTKKFSISSSLGLNAKQIAQKLQFSHKDFFTLDDLKKELKFFLHSHGLPLGVIGKDWKMFRKSLLEIVVDCPVIFTSDDLYSMECTRQGENTYSYKFTLFLRSKEKPIIKLKLK